MSQTAIILTNVGSPDSTAPKDVRRYLGEFLMDERVIDVPYLLRFLLVKGIIAPLRARSSAKKYETIWTDEGSPLIVTTKKLAERIAEVAGIPCYWCMRYATPSAEHTLRQIHRNHPTLKQLVIFPLYPHYAMSSYETGVVDIEENHARGGYSSEIKVVPPFYEDPQFIQVLASQLRPVLDQVDYDYVLFSYHGIPERHVKKTDPTGEHCYKCENCCEVASPAHAYCYRHQVIRTTEETAAVLKLPEGKYGFSFQSRLGRDPWLKPYTAPLLEELPKRGIKNLVILCPAFVSDCLETLEEIHEEGREIFLEAGGESFHSVPCLNLNENWVRVASMLAQRQLEKVDA